MNSDIKTCLQDSFTVSTGERYENVHASLTSRSTMISKTTSSTQYVPDTSRRPFTNQDIIILGSIFCAVIMLSALITFLILCVLRRKSNSFFILPQWKKLIINSDCNIKEYKPKLKYKLKPLHLVIKHQDYLNEKERKRNSRLKENEKTLSEKIETCQPENNLQQENNKINNTFQRDSSIQKCKNEQKKDLVNDNIELDEKMIDINVKDKGEKVEICEVEDDSPDKNFYDDLTINDIIEMFKTLNDNYLCDINYNYN